MERNPNLFPAAALFVANLPPVAQKSRSLPSPEAPFFWGPGVVPSTSPIRCYEPSPHTPRRHHLLQQQHRQLQLAHFPRSHPRDGRRVQALGGLRAAHRSLDGHHRRHMRCSGPGDPSLDHDMHLILLEPRFATRTPEPTPRLHTTHDPPTSLAPPEGSFRPSSTFPHAPSVSQPHPYPRPCPSLGQESQIPVADHATVQAAPYRKDSEHLVGGRSALGNSGSSSIKAGLLSRQLRRFDTPCLAWLHAVSQTGLQHGIRSRQRGRDDDNEEFDRQKNLVGRKTGSLQSQMCTLPIFTRRPPPPPPPKSPWALTLLSHSEAPSPSGLHSSALPCHLLPIPSRQEGSGRDCETGPQVPCRRAHHWASGWPGPGTMV